VTNIRAVLNQLPFPEGRRCTCERIAAALGPARRAQRLVAVMVLGLDERNDDEARSDDAQGALFYWQAKASAGSYWTRIGPATFAVVASIGTSSEAYGIATNLLDTVDRTFRYGERRACGAWLGFSLSPEDGDDAYLLLARADAAFEALRCLSLAYGVGPGHHYWANRVAAWKP
jgi:predicted signal transduction protein with EAL and GGDEF domain